MNTTPMNIPMSVAEFATSRNVTERTVNNWLAADRLTPAPVKVGGKWAIAHDAQLRPSVGARTDGRQVVATATFPDLPDSAIAHLRAIEPARTPLGELDDLTGFVDLDVAARLLGLKVGTLSNPANRARFGVEKLGGRFVMPQAAIRNVFGA